jgi:hypothetical protein
MERKKENNEDRRNGERKEGVNKEREREWSSGV